MKIDVLSHTTLKLTLTPVEMSENKLCCEALSSKGKDCRRTLEKLLRRGASSESAWLAEKLLKEQSRLLVEAFPRLDGGCMVYLSALEGGGKAEDLSEEAYRARPIIFETESGESLGKLCRCLVLEQQRGAMFNSVLFSDSESYRLELIPLNVCTGRLMRVLKEYGEAVNSELAAAFTEEHFTLLTEEAVAVCAELF